MALLLRASKVADGKAEILVDSGQVIIGQLPSNNLVLPGPNVEAIHAMIEFNEAGEPTIMDMGSDSGVKLNGRTIEVVETIKYGDVVEIGSVRISVLDPSRAAAPPEMPQPTTTPPPPPPPMPAAGLKPVPNFQKTVVAVPNEIKTGEQVSSETQPQAELGKTIVQAPLKQKAKREASVENFPEEDRKAEQNPVAVIAAPVLFRPGKERPTGATVEVVAFWKSSILDVRHYGGKAEKDEAPRPDDIYIGNEEDGHLIGVGPASKTRNLLLGKVSGSQSTVFLNSEMKARVRRGGRFEKVDGPREFTLSNKETALVRHGPIEYFLMNVALPDPELKRYEDLDGKPIIFWWASAIYAVLALLIVLSGPPKTQNLLTDEEKWDTVLTARTPTPTPAPTAPPPKPKIEVPKPKETPPPIKETPKPTPQPTPRKEPEKPKPIPTPVPQRTQNPAPKLENKAAKDKALGRPSPKLAPGNGGGAAGGTAGASAGQRRGDDKIDGMGAEGGKKNVVSGINFDKLGAGLGKTMDKDAIGAIATGLKSSSGGEGAGGGTGKRNAHGFGGLGNSASLGTGGPANALAGLGGGAGGLGAGGLGGPGGTGSGEFGKKLKGSAVVVPDGDVVTEGSLTKEEIEAVIRANLAQIKWCYEKNLQGNRQLSGRVVSAFVIGTNGRVTSSDIAQSTLNSSGTESCIRDAVSRWKFPLPRGGGVVNVKYPFVLQPR
jgi:outer membrane biosynthesis protein TonB/pSer/pThr/pTyr-binding forkhead associated (FHA) protein